jgi:predicted membrane channel-forming protein YqfA (hemolysin III family)
MWMARMNGGMSKEEAMMQKMFFVWFFAVNFVFMFLSALFHCISHFSKNKQER